MTTEPRRDPHRRWTLFVWFASVVSLVLIHGPLIGYKTYANVDEAYAAALAERLTEGYKLYQGAVSQRGPLMYYIFELLDRIDGWDNILALRLWALALAIAHLGMVYWAGRKLLSRAAATIALGLSGYALSFGFPPEDAIAINGEPLQLPALIIAVVLGFTAVRCAPGTKERARALITAGISLGIAIAIKQSVALHFLPIALYLLVDSHRRGQPLRRFWIDVSMLALATLVVPVLFVLNSAREGTLKDFYYYCVTYNAEVHLRPSPKHFTWLPTFFFRLNVQTLFFMVVVLLFGAGLAYARRRVRSARKPVADGGGFFVLFRGFGPREYLAFHLALALFSATVMYRFFPHYYLQAAPFMSLCVAAVVARIANRRGDRGWTVRAVTVVFMTFVLFTAALGCDFGERIDGRVTHDRTVIDVSKLITATTKPDDKIFVWGFSPWIYGYSHRRPAGRYMFETYVTGFVPWFWEKLSIEKARIVPGSTEALLEDLDREDPAVVVDSGTVMMGRPMRSYEKPNAWLHAKYCFDLRIGALDVYRRKEAGKPCAVPFFPRPHEVVDYRGATIGVPFARTLDYDTSPPLPQGNFYKPLYFPNYPAPPGLEAIRDFKREKEEREGTEEGFTVIDMDPSTAVKPATTDKTEGAP